MNYCTYYQAYVEPRHAWYLTAVLRSFEHLVFDRTLDVKNSIFEFFVPPQLESYFVEIMNAMEQEGIVSNIQKLPNRFESEDLNS
jgi:hypothetical protein